jgi:zinc protease
MMLASLVWCALAAGSGIRADSAPAMFDVGGIRVIHQRRTNNDAVIARLYLLGGARQLDSRTAGIEAMLLRATQYGSARYPGAATQQALARTGSEISVSAEDDWSVLSLRTVRVELDSAWSVFADRLMHPTLAEIDVDRVRTRMLTELLADAGSPDGIVRQLVRSRGFAGHAYVNDPNGTDASLRGIAAQAVRHYHEQQVVKSRMLLVVVGNVERASIERLVAASLAQLPAGTYVWTMPPALPTRETSMVILPRKLETDYIIGVFSGPLTNAREFGSFRVATGLLGAYVNRVIREEQHLAYSAYAPLFDNAATAGAVYVSTTSPEKVMDLMLKQFEQVANEGLPMSAIPWFVSQYSIEALSEQETNAGEAAALACGFLLFGDFRATDAPLKAMNSASEDRIRLVAAKYMPGVQFIFVGDTSRFHKFMR